MKDLKSLLANIDAANDQLQDAADTTINKPKLDSMIYTALLSQLNDTYRYIKKNGEQISNQPIYSDESENFFNSCLSRINNIQDFKLTPEYLSLGTNNEIGKEFLNPEYLAENKEEIETLYKLIKKNLTALKETVKFIADSAYRYIPIQFTQHAIDIEHSRLQYRLNLALSEHNISILDNDELVSSSKTNKLTSEQCLVLIENDSAIKSKYEYLKQLTQLKKDFINNPREAFQAISNNSSDSDSNLHSFIKKISSLINLSVPLKTTQSEFKTFKDNVISEIAKLAEYKLVDNNLLLNLQKHILRRSTVQFNAQFNAQLNTTILNKLVNTWKKFQQDIVEEMNTCLPDTAPTLKYNSDRNYIYEGNNPNRALSIDKVKEKIPNNEYLIEKFKIIQNTLDQATTTNASKKPIDKIIDFRDDLVKNRKTLGLNNNLFYRAMIVTANILNVIGLGIPSLIVTGKFSLWSEPNGKKLVDKSLEKTARIAPKRNG